MGGQTRIIPVRTEWDTVTITVYEHGEGTPVAVRELTPQHAIRLAYNILKAALQ